MAAPTASEAAYIASAQAHEVAQYAIGGAAVVLAIVGIFAAWLLIRDWRQHRPPCGVHQFGARQEHVRDGEVWRPIYVRDVCVHCGATVERTDALFDKPDMAEQP